ncbi:MAG TPA: branched-chain amino acid ABC transporter substrate-binding protein [Candidatus Saccharimonadales bacterium]|nr:branched-chain amino acid ABC transporter substrate-binding protein [Candidatus Saccharimonadales bacterium]
MKLTKLGALVAGAVLAFGACSSGSTPSPVASVAPASGGSSPAASAAGNINVKIGIELPMTGGEAPNGVPTANGVALALSQLSVPGFNITIEQEDDAVNGKHNANQGATNIQTLANDSSVLFVVGPFNSNVAQAEIPVSNGAGLMQCSPANTAVSLTKGPSAVTLRPTNPTKIAYVRVATTDDNQGAAGADIAYNIVGAKTAYVLDDTQTYGKGLADGFTTAYTTLGGKILKRDGVPDSTTDFTSYVTTAQGLNPAYVFYGGVTTSGLGLFRHQMAQQGIANIPFGGGDGINDGSAATASSFLNIAGPAGDMNTYSTVAAIHDIPNAGAFTAAYKAKFNTDPGAYSAPAYACTQVFLAALKAVSPGVTDLAALREAVRAYVADPSHKYDTVLGSVGFDANGDTTQHTISYYKFDPTTKDWAFFKQRDFTADPIK